MYQSIDFGQLGGFPLTQNKMAFIQDSYNKVLESLCGVIGQYAIIEGVVHDGSGNYSAGWITYDGEIIPFVAAPVSQGSNVTITETRETVTYRDTSMHDVIITRTATFGATGEPFSSFTRHTLQSLNSDVQAVGSTANSALTNANAALAAANTALTNANTALVTANAALVAAALPSGVILIWKGSVATIPAGYVLCNGLNGTPDLRGRFVPGAGGSYAVGLSGGADSVTLALNQMPSHRHIVKEVNRGDEGSSGTDQSVGSFTEAGTDKFSSYVGGDKTDGTQGVTQSHENRPLFRAYCYIMKT